jgi:hypothetical protein
MAAMDDVEPSWGQGPDAAPPLELPAAFADRGANVPVKPVEAPLYVAPSAEPPVPGGPAELAELQAASQPVYDVYGPPPAGYQALARSRDGMPFIPGMHVEAIGQLGPPMGGHSLGVAVLAIAIGVAVGAKYGGSWGGVSGSLFGGTAANAWQAVRNYKLGTEDGDREGRIHVAYGLIALVAGGLIWWKLVPRGSARARVRRNPEDEPADTEPFRQTPCGIRPVGP